MTTKRDNIVSWRSPDAKSTVLTGTNVPFGKGRKFIVLVKGKTIEKSVQPAQVAPKVKMASNIAPNVARNVAGWRREKDAYKARVARRAQAKALTPKEIANREAALAASKMAA